mmetsp:Transcript_92090/g.134586  ORF Transcript_92090/g.134586 Transcript_92090/m.134586 type:complete len:285 (-) Transcript_92090:198-1052(-)
MMDADADMSVQCGARKGQHTKILDCFYPPRWVMVDPRGGSAIISRRATVSDSLLGPKRSVGVSPPKKERKGAGVDDSERDDALDEAGLLEVCHVLGLLGSLGVEKGHDVLEGPLHVETLFEAIVRLLPPRARCSLLGLHHRFLLHRCLLLHRHGGGNSSDGSGSRLRRGSSSNGSSISLGSLGGLARLSMTAGNGDVHLAGVHLSSKQLAAVHGNAPVFRRPDLVRQVQRTPARHVVAPCLAISSIHVSLHGLLALLDQRELLLLGLHGHTLTVTLANEERVGA